MKCNQSRSGFELVSPCPFPTTITITPRALPKFWYLSFKIKLTSLLKKILVFLFMTDTVYVYTPLCSMWLRDNFLSPRLVAYPCLKNQVYPKIYPYLQSIRALWNTITLVQDLKLCRCVHFLQRQWYFGCRLSNILWWRKTSNKIMMFAWLGLISLFNCLSTFTRYLIPKSFV